MAQLNSEQVAQLLKPIKPSRILQANNQSHVPAYDVAAHLTRMFGFGGWDTENCVVTLCFEDFEERVKSGTPPKPYKVWTVGYVATIRLIIKNEHGEEIAHYENGAGGDAINQPARGDAHHLAMTTAISTALKRCAAFGLGDQFGLSLYNKGMVTALIGKTLVMPSGAETVARTTDLEGHIPLPESIGNDERQGGTQADDNSGGTDGDGGQGGEGATGDSGGQSEQSPEITPKQAEIRAHAAYAAMTSTEKGALLAEVVGAEVRSIRELSDNTCKKVLAKLDSL